MSPAESQKIAAGEVVERPYNIVKELIENALDAHATDITLHIEDGGKRRIHCIDNGVGMDEADARMCIEHHATSKLTTVNDLERITTYGFRGEALSSIASISSMTLRTQQQGAEFGTEISIKYGDVTAQTAVVRSVGTEIIIDNIFENIPARKKFLKTRETEWRAIYTLVQALALAYPQVSFTLSHDHNQMLITRATDSLAERIAQLFDRNFSEHTVLCSRTHSDITLSGGITRQEYTRFDKQQQFFFVNKRWVKNYKLGQALMKGYSNVLPPGKYPAAIIFIELPTAEVDINVHPRKEEVVFLHPRLVEQELTQMVHKQLASLTTSQMVQQVPSTPRPFIQPLAMPVWHQPAPYHQQPLPPSIINALPEPFQEQAPIVHQAHDPRPGVIIGQALQTYIIVESPEGIVLVDQHAAHEAVLFEQFSRRAHEIARVRLLFPELINLQPTDQELLFAHTTELAACGIVVEQAGPQAVAITETPVHLKNYNLKELITDLLGWLAEYPQVTPVDWHAKVGKKLFAMMACKAAVKAHDTLTLEKMQEIIELLHKTEHRQTCPHGRPTTWLISQYDLEKKFKRAT